MAQHMPEEPEPDFDDTYLEENYYTLLNVEKNATSEDVTNSYRRLSRLYHPDKHMDPLKKKNAETLFNKVKKAHEVLIDGHKRAIYDTLGLKGLETDGWQVVQRTKTPQEIREEYEQLLKEREDRKLQQRTNPKGVISVGVNATDLFDAYDLDAGFPNIEISSMNISQSVDAPLNTSDTLTLSGNLNTQNGIGGGSVALSLRKVVSSKTWAEFALGAGNGLVFTIKGFRTFTNKCFGTLQGSFHFTPLGIAPGVQAVLARQLDRHTAGYLTWKAGSASSINSSIVWDSSKGHFTGGLQFGAQNSFVTMSYTYKAIEDVKIRGAIKFGLFGAVLEYGCDRKISQHSVVGASLAVGVPSGVTLKLKVNRANQTYLFPILLSDEIVPSAVFYGTITPVIGWYILKVMVIDPYQKHQQKMEAEKAQEANASKLAERKKEANIAVTLMQETYNRIKSQEESKNGLIILKAIYGKSSEFIDVGDDVSNCQTMMDVTVQLQCLVKDSRLTLPGASKCDLPGFYDPCLREDKSLLVNYTYRNVVHSITIDDKELLRIPIDY